MSWVMSAPVPLGYAESGDGTEREKDPTQNKMIRDPGDACAEERQGSEQSKVARLGVHCCLALVPDEKGAATRLPPTRVEGLEPLMRPPRQDGRPSFWERP